MEREGNDVPKPLRSGIAFAKTTRPTMGSAVERESLFRHLDTPAGRTVAWISGPPGSGKTTLAASYTQARRLQAVWYQIDADDADPASFFHFLAHAARKLGGARANELPAFTPQHADNVASFARKFFRQLFAGVTEPLAVVLDNLHAVPADSALYAAFEAGFSQVPKGCCILVTSRDAPLASLARMQATGQMCCVTGSELRVGPEDIVAIAALRGQIVSPEAAARLYERTQGWAAGLVLMLEHSKFSGRIVDVPDDAAPQVIFDFLAGEIFDRFDVQTREFLLRIACLPRMTADLAAKLSGEPKAERLLQNLARNDYFVRDVASEAGRVYQMHPLLREFLRQRAVQALPEAVSADWLRKAAMLMQEVGETEDAVALLVDAGDWDEVARVALRESEAILAQGRSETLAHWLELLPPALIESDPRLLHAWAAARAQSSPRAARQLFERAFDGFRAVDDVSGMTRCACGVVDAIVFEFDDITPLDRWLETLDGLLASTTGDDAPAFAVGAATTAIRAGLLRDAGNPRITRWLEHAMRATESGAVARRSDAERAELLFARVMFALARGDASAAESLLGSLRSDGYLLPSSARLALAMVTGLQMLITGAYAGVRSTTQDALAMADAEGIHAYDNWLWILSGAAGMNAGDRAGVRAAIGQLEADGNHLRRGDRACVCFLRSWLAAVEGDAIGAQREAKVALAVAIESGIPWFEALARIALAHLQLGGADRHGMEAQLRGADAIAARLESPWLRLGVDLAASAGARQQGAAAVALDRLRDGFGLAQEHGIRPPPGAQPAVLAELCSSALEAQVAPEYARCLVREGSLAPRAPRLLVRDWPWPFRMITLGGFLCLRHDVPIELSGKGPGRPTELLKVLIALGRHSVRTEQLADALWPHMEADYAYKSFTATLHRLRRALGEDDAVVLRDGRLTLNKAMVWVDTWALEQLLDDFEPALRGTDLDDSAVPCRKYVADALSIYRGPFLPDESDQPSYIACREQQRSRLLRFLGRMARMWEERRDPEAAANIYLRFIEVDELCEPLYRQLMLCYERTGARIEALSTYERLRTILTTRLKAMPSAETQSLYARLKSGGLEAAAG